MDDRLSHVMDRRAFAIGSELQKLGPGGRVAASRPIPVKVDGTRWEYQWQIVIAKNPFDPLPLPHRAEGWDVFAYTDAGADVGRVGRKMLEE